MTHHLLKCAPVPFEATWTGIKAWEIRLDDRYYQRHDTVTLHEFEQDATCTCPQADRKKHRPPAECEKYSGRSIDATIGFLCSSTPSRGSVRGFHGNGYIVFSLVDMVKTDGRAKRAVADEVVIVTHGPGPSAADAIKAMALRQGQVR